MGKLFAVVLAIITIVSAAIFAMHIWWMPVDISVHGPALDKQFGETLLGTGIGFLVAQLSLAVFVWKFSGNNDGRKVREFPGGARVMVLTAVILVGIEILALSFVGSRAWAAVNLDAAPANALHIDVQAEQFAFYFRYAGPDGQFGVMHPEKMSDANGNYFGLDPENDVAARDDIIVASLTIPVNQPIALALHAKDVGHSLYVRELRIQQDFVPGIVIPVHFTATQTGKFEIVCTQLCGLGHYSMRAYLQVVTQDEYDQWLKSQAGQ